MNLKILLPTDIFYQGEVVKIIAEGKQGFFTLLPRHIDFVGEILPGILYIYPQLDEEQYIAVDQGILVKAGVDVSISSRHAIKGTDLATLEKIVEQEFKILDDQERKARSASARLEAGIIRKFIEFEK
jgi:F-type H+-transporting ATPase subunit epsilon